MTDPAAEARLFDRLFVGIQKLLPTRLLSSLMFRIAQSRNPAIARLLIRWFARRYDIVMADAEFELLGSYDSFAAFFTRALKPGARSLPRDAMTMASPVDGTISQCGAIQVQQLIQAKGLIYSAADLLGDKTLADQFISGSFATIYLSPRDYHRVHMPLDGRLRQWSYVPGRLFSVNPATVRALPGVFALNERLCAIFDTDFGPMAVVLVGALFVGGLETVWTGRVTPPHRRETSPTVYQPMEPVALLRGAELGRFNFGSTVILLLPAGVARWRRECIAGATVRMGQAVADMKYKPANSH
jgi:phosphatidylserine decarboxylase